MCDVVFAKDIPFVRVGRAKSPLEIERVIVDTIKQDSLPLIYLGFVGVYDGVRSKIRLECKKCGCVRDASVSGLIHRGSVCPCNGREKRILGNNPLRKRKKKATKQGLYIVRSAEPVNGVYIGKIGISNNPKHRVYSISSRTGHKFEMMWVFECEDKEKLHKLEKELKNSFCNDDMKKYCSYGYTESFLFDCIKYNKIVSHYHDVVGLI